MSRPRLWEPLLRPLMDRPGVWVTVRTYERSCRAWQVVADLRRGDRVLPPGQWAFQSEQVEPNRPGWAVRACYLGPATDDAQTGRDRVAT